MVSKMGRAYEAVVVGSGPNGLAAAIALKQAGLSVLLIEGKEELGGGVRSGSLLMPGIIHDICSAIHPLAAASPFFRQLPLAEHGLEFIYPEYAAAHPLEDGRAAILAKSIYDTIDTLEEDAHNYKQLITGIANDFPLLIEDVLSPLKIPAHPVKMGLFGLKAIRSANAISRRFDTDLGKALWGGVAAHAIYPFNGIATAAIGLVLLGAAHAQGWPLPKGGAGSLTQALAACFKSLGGEIQTGWMVKDIDELPESDIVLLDVTPKQLLEISGHRFSGLYKRQLQRYRYGMGIFKVDWILDGEVPFTNEQCRRAGTVHLGNTYEEIARSEYDTYKGRYVEKPFVLLAQQASFDATRTRDKLHPVWGYCHVPHGSDRDMTLEIEQQVERFAPGFRDRIVARTVSDTREVEAYNPNYIGGDINGGVINITQLFTRPALRPSPYRTSTRGVYICSSSTPPGGGVHGMCGFYAARRALKDIYNIKISI